MYGKTLSDYPEKFEAFRGALVDLKPEQIDYGFQRAVKLLKDFPIPSQIREYAEQMPVQSGNYNAMVEAYKAKHREENEPRERLGEPPVDTREAFEAALVKVSEAKRMDAPGKTLHEQHRAAALQRLGGSTMPMPREDGTPVSLLIEPERLEANREWAHGMAVKNGWIQEREPGCDE